MTVVPYRDRGCVRSSATAPAMFEITMLDGSLIVTGAHYPPNEFNAPR